METIMETIMNYSSIAGNFIFTNSETILNILILILFLLLILWDFQIFNKLYKRYKKSLNDIFLLKIGYGLHKEKINILKKEIKDLKNQKRVEKYYLKKRFLALENGILIIQKDGFIKNINSIKEKNIYKRIKQEYYKLNKKSFSNLEKIKKDLQKK